VAHRPLVEQRMEEIRDQLRASDPVEMRRRANSALMRILAGRLDPKHRRTALDVLRYLDSQERVAEKAERESLRTAMAQLALLDAMEGRGDRPRSSARQRKPKEMPAKMATNGEGDEHPLEQNRVRPEGDADAERRRAEIEAVIADRRRIRSGGGN
jgi:hypothetical protein